MRNHFHFVLETPEPNLVYGMKWLLGTYTKRFNIRHQLCGHLFAGRYKALLVEGSGNGYLRTVCDYVHLNPVRAHLLAADAPLQAYRWSSYGHYLQPSPQRPAWLRVDRLLGEKAVPQDSAAGREQFARLMESRRSQEIAADYEAVRRDWIIGSSVRKPFARNCCLQPPQALVRRMTRRNDTKSKPPKQSGFSKPNCNGSAGKNKH